MRALGAAATALFVFAAGVQWNDPDPLRWIGFYGLAAAASLGLVLDRAWRALEIAAALLAAGVVLALAPALSRARLEAFTSFHMKSSGDELVRELGGAAIVLVWSCALVIRRARLRRE